jgi:voltage-gated potassium channel Kch
MTVMIKINSREKLKFFVLFTFIVITGGALFYHRVEGFEIIDSFYFTVITLGTVGYGDLAPVTVIGKIFTSFYVFLGIGFFFAFASVMSEFIFDYYTDKDSRALLISQIMKK